MLAVHPYSALLKGAHCCRPTSDDSIRDSSWSTVVVSLVALREITQEGETALELCEVLEPHLALKDY